jgi:hypothetical protein
MSRKSWALLVLVAGSANLIGAEKPPYQRQLQGDDAKQAAALEKRVEELWAAGKFAEAVAPAEEALSLRRVQGGDHWEAADAARKVQTLRQGVALPAPRQADLAKAPGMMAEGEQLHGQAKYAEAEPLFFQRDGLKEGLPKAQALREAKTWLRTLPRAEAERLAGRLAGGELRASERPRPTGTPKEPPAAHPAVPEGKMPFAHPRYWAAFVLIGDPD